MNDIDIIKALNLKSQESISNLVYHTENRIDEGIWVKFEIQKRELEPFIEQNQFAENISKDSRTLRNFHLKNQS